MGVSNSLRRLLQIRDLEQEQHRLAFESAQGELRALEEALGRASERERAGRGEVAASVQDNAQAERHPALAEVEIGRRHARVLTPRIKNAEAETARRRFAFLAKRTEHKQAETLIREGEEQESMEAARRSRQALDEWFLSRFLRESVSRESSIRENAGAAPDIFPAKSELDFDVE